MMTFPEVAVLLFTLRVAWYAPMSLDSNSALPPPERGEGGGGGEEAARTPEPASPLSQPSPTPGGRGEKIWVQGHRWNPCVVLRVMHLWQVHDPAYSTRCSTRMGGGG